MRWNAIFWFYDNSGNLKFSSPQSSSGLSMGTDRGDRERIGSDIRSHYVYFAGPNPNPSGVSCTGVPVWLAIWDANTGQFVTATNVSNDIDPTAMGVQEANVAADALDRLTVAWDCIPNTADFPRYQVVARVMKFDGAKISFLTPSFYPFVNYDAVGTNNQVNFMNETPSIAMTTRQICISAKGQVNSTNNPAGGPDTPYADSGFNTYGGIDFYTVLSHPAPVDAPKPQMKLAYSSPNSTISWLADDGLFVLQSTSTVAVPASWTDVSPQPAITRVGPGDATDRFQMSVPNGASPKFYRLLRRW